MRKNPKYSWSLSNDLCLCAAATSNPLTPKPELFNTLLYSLVPIMGIAAILLFSFWMYHHHKLAYPPMLVPTQVCFCVHIDTPFITLLLCFYYNRLMGRQLTAFVMW